MSEDCLEPNATWDQMLTKKYLTPETGLLAGGGGAISNCESVNGWNDFWLPSSPLRTSRYLVLITCFFEANSWLIPLVFEGDVKQTQSKSTQSSTVVLMANFSSNG